MNQQEKINSRQNDVNILKCQYASRYFFNTAENYNTAAIILSILSALCILVPDTHKCLSLLLPLIFDTLVFVFYLRMGQLISDAALLRNHFDKLFLNLKTLNFLKRICAKSKRSFSSLPVIMLTVKDKFLIRGGTPRRVSETGMNFLRYILTQR